MDETARRMRRLGAAIVSAVLALGFLGLGGASVAQGRAAVPMAVPPATGNSAVITVSVGADRQGTTAVSGLAGVTLQLYDGTTAPTTPVAESWATCTSDADGDCSFVVPSTQSGGIGCFGAAGANCDRRFWVVQTGVPAGFTQNASFRTGNGDGTGSQQTPYQFRTGTTLRAGNTYRSDSDFMIGTGSTNRSASGGIWQQSRTNPAPVQQCGLSVALVLDLSGSVTAAQLVQLKAASDSFVDSLVGTPSEMALFSFSTASPAVGATQNYPGLTSVSTQAGADAFKARYAGWTASGGTNWDRGLASVAEAASAYDIAVVITDGNPTFYSQPAEGPGNFTRLREMENGVFSANAVKAEDTRVLAVGVGAGVSDSATGQNLRAISGPTLYDGTNASTADYYQATDYAAVGQALRQLALGECAGSVSVVKQLVDSSGDLAAATPGGAGWVFDASTTSPGVTIATPTTTTDSSSAVNFPITYAGGATTGTIEVQEQPQAGTTLFPVDGANAVCIDLAANLAVSVENAGATGFTVEAPSEDAVSCTVYNQVAAPATVAVDKEWVINGADPVPNGNQPPGFTSQLTLSGPGGAGPTDQPWQVVRTGYVAGESVTIGEEVTLQTPDIDPDLCTVSAPQIVEIDGEVVTPVPVPDAGYETTLVEGANTFTIRNTVTCESRLTLAKYVEGAADPALWTLEALPAPDAPDGQLPGPSGQAGSAEVTDVSVTAGVPYQLAESGPPEYVQVDQRTDQQVYPRSTGSWTCIRIGSDGDQISGFNDGLNGGVTVPIAERVRCTVTNQTAQLILAKEVNNTAGGNAVASDFTLRAVPGTTPPVTGLPDVEVEGAAQADAEVIEIRPGHPYTLSESGPAGYALTDLQCTIDGVPQPATTVTVGRGQTVVCLFVNVDNPAELTLRKDVDVGTTGATQTSADWTLTATPQAIEDQEPVSGNGEDGVTGEEVAAGAYALSESDVPGFDAGTWVCLDAGGEDVTVTAGVVTLANGSAVTCTITNTAQQPTLTLVKEVTNNDGGTAEDVDWTLSATGPTTGLTGATGDAEITDAPVAIGSYALAEDGPPGYTAGSWVCADGGTDVPVTDEAITIGLGQDVTCTIENDDQPALLTLRKVVDPGITGATQTAADWTLTADGPDSVTGNGADGVTDAVVPAGSYALSESTVTGFTAGTWNCLDAGGAVPVDDGAVALTNGADVTCTITNTAEQPTLTLVKVVANDQGGSAVIGDWTLSATGPTTGLTGATDDAAITDAPVAIGSYALAEDGPPGYTAGAWTCTDGGTDVPVTDGAVTIGLGQDVTCTIENDDQPALLTLRKVVDAGVTGATAEPADWTVRAAPEDIPGQDLVEGDGADGVTDVAVFAGPYALSESFVDGFSAGTWSCADSGGGTVAVDEGTVTLISGADVTCTITNTAVPSTLTLAKTVTNDDGGTADARDWVLTALGPTTTRSGASGDDIITSTPVEVGSHALSESGGPSGYTTNDWTCADGDTDLPVEAGSVLIGLGQDVTCTVLNDDQPGTLTLVKEVVNDGGGTAEAADWTLTADGPTTGVAAPGDEFDSVSLPAGQYVLSEIDGPSGYGASPWSCTGGELTGSTVTLANGADVTCTITNRFQPPLLTLVKQVVNDGGGTAVATDWTLAADGPLPVSGTTGSTPVTGAPVSPGTYTLSESGPAGYASTGWVCENRGAPVTLDGADLDLAAGDDVTCTVTNVFTPAPVSTWIAEKTSDPPSGTPVEPGQVLTYTIRAGIVTGDSAADVVVVDDLSGVLGQAVLLEDSIEATAGTVTLSGTRLTWTLSTLQGTQTLTYEVRADDDVDGELLRNAVTAPGALPCLPDGPVLGAAVITEEDCRTTTHEVLAAGTPSPAARWIASTGGPGPWLGLGALALLAAGSAMTWVARRGARAQVVAR